MKTLDGVKYTFKCEGIEIQGVLKAVVDKDTVTVERVYAHNGMGNGDCLGVETTTYSRDSIDIQER